MKKEKKIDWLLIIPYLLVSLIGLLMVYSASSYRLIVQEQNALDLFMKQVVFMILSWIAMFVIYRVKKEVILGKGFAYLLLGLGVISLILTRVGGIGVGINGAQRWVQIFGIQFQPSEVTNLAIILYLAYIFRSPKETLKEMRTPLIIVGICTLLILFQPKVAGAILLLILAGVIITTSQVPVRLTLIIFAAFMGILVLLGGGIMLLGNHDLLPQIFAHTYDRIRMIGNPFSDPYGQGFQMSHSYYALYNGGLWGLGLGNSITKKGFLPVAETDFIFSVLVEEMGLIMGLFVLGLLFFIILRLFKLGAMRKNQQESLIFLGVGTLLLLQTSINIASIAGLIPMTGVPLPFISYGGSSYLLLSLGIGICLKFSGRGEVK